MSAVMPRGRARAEERTWCLSALVDAEARDHTVRLLLEKNCEEIWRFRDPDPTNPQTDGFGVLYVGYRLVERKGRCSLVPDVLRSPPVDGEKRLRVNGICFVLDDRSVTDCTVTGE